MLSGLLGAILEYLGDLLSSYRILEPFWGHAETCFWGFLELSWSISVIFSRLMASWSHFGAMLEPSWGYVGAMLTSWAASKASGLGGTVPKPKGKCAFLAF